MPLICWRISSVEAAKAVLPMALARIEPGMVMEVVSRASGIEGNVSGSLPARRYLPSPEVMLMANVLSSTEKVRGTSSRFFVSNPSSKWK